jgi:tripartite-type tricarboxylate transporter receptor subunit TctC
MRRTRSRFFVAGPLVILALLAAQLLVIPAAKAEYPERAVTVVVPFPPGGVTDLGARAFADGMEKLLKQPFVVVNKPGGATTIGGNAVATAKPDGYTLGYFPPMASIAEVYSYFYQAPYTSKDLQPVCRMATAVGAICVKGDSPINDYKDLVEHLRKNPGTKWGINTKTSPSYIIMRAIAKRESLNIIDVAFDGDTQIVPAILGGHILLGSPTYPSVRSLVDAKKIKIPVLLVERWEEFMPKVSTIVEYGYRVPPGLTNSVFTPKGTPADIVKKLNDTAAKLSQEPAFRSKLMDLGILPSYLETNAFEGFIQQEIKDLQGFFKEEGLVK